MIHPITPFVRAGVLAPWLGPNEPFRLIDDAELTGLENFTDEHRFMEMVVALVDFLESAGRIEPGTVDRLANGVHVRGARFLDRFFPDVNAQIGRLDRIIRHAARPAGKAFLLAICFEVPDEFFILRGVDRLVIVPGGEVAHQGFCVHAAQFILGHTKRHDGHVLGAKPLVGEFLVKGNVAVAVDGAQHGGVPARREGFHLADDGLIILVMERGVLFHDIFSGNTLGQKERPQDLVRRPRENIIRSKEVELLEAAAVRAHEVFGRRDELLVRRSAGIENIFGALFTLILHGIEEQAVIFFEHRQDRFAAHRCPASESDRDFVFQ